jgi:hypothetical protein
MPRNKKPKPTLKLIWPLGKLDRQNNIIGVDEA